jgi:hypothetical protein
MYKSGARGDVHDYAAKVREYISRYIAKVRVYILTKKQKYKKKNESKGKNIL